MKSLMKIVGASVLVLGSALASNAKTDVSLMTCGDFGMLDDADRATAAHDLLGWINETANFETAGASLTGRYDVIAPDPEDATTDSLKMQPDNAWTSQEMKIEIEGHCINMPMESNVIEQLRSNP